MPDRINTARPRLCTYEVLWHWQASPSARPVRHTTRVYLAVPGNVLEQARSVLASMYSRGPQDAGRVMIDRMTEVEDVL
jgi:hypothetical protein